jgi:hypothetical protein
MLELLRPAALKTDAGFVAALEVFQNQLLQRNPRFDRVLEGVLNVPGLLLNIINSMSLSLVVLQFTSRRFSGISIPASNALWAYMKSQFPKESIADFFSGLSYQILSQLETFLDDIGVPGDLRLKMPTSSRSLASFMPILRKLQPNVASETDAASAPPHNYPENLPRTRSEMKQQSAKVLRMLQSILKVSCFVTRRTSRKILLTDPNSPRVILM